MGHAFTSTHRCRERAKPGRPRTPSGCPRAARCPGPCGSDVGRDQRTSHRVSRRGGPPHASTRIYKTPPGCIKPVTVPESTTHACTLVLRAGDQALVRFGVGHGAFLRPLHTCFTIVLELMPAVYVRHGLLGGFGGLMARSTAPGRTIIRVPSSQQSRFAGPAPEPIRNVLELLEGKKLTNPITKPITPSSLCSRPTLTAIIQAPTHGREEAVSPGLPRPLRLFVRSTLREKTFSAPDINTPPRTSRTSCSSTHTDGNCRSSSVFLICAQRRQPERTATEPGPRASCPSPPSSPAAKKHATRREPSLRRPYHWVEREHRARRPSPPYQLRREHPLPSATMELGTERKTARLNDTDDAQAARLPRPSQPRRPRPASQDTGNGPRRPTGLGTHAPKARPPALSNTSLTACTRSG